MTSCDPLMGGANLLPAHHARPRRRHTVVNLRDMGMGKILQSGELGTLLNRHLFNEERYID
jgi:hypothetical protein